MSRNLQQFVPWDFNAPQAIRDAIIKDYVPAMLKGSDERYQNEYDDNSAANYTTQANDRLKLVNLLESHGIRVTKIQNAGDFNGQGGGNYWALTLEMVEMYNASILFISDLGKFVARDIIWFQSDNTYADIDDHLSVESKARLETCKRIISQNGYIWVNEELLSQEVPGLYLQLFGRQEEPRICDLLFYWIN